MWGTRRREQTRNAVALESQATDVRDKPLNAVEQALVDARDGRDSSDAWLTLLWQHPLHIATATPPATMGDITPPMYDVHGVTYITAFTAPDRLHSMREHCPYGLTLSRGGDFISQLRPEVGLVLNPTFPALGVQVPPDALARLRATHS